MSTDVAKLLILVTTKGAKEAAKDQDKLTDSSNKLGKQTKKTTANQKKFTTAQNKFRTSLPAVASGLYLVQQAYSALNGIVTELNNSYKLQFDSEVKLQTILRTTSNAIGYTYDQLDVMAQSWQKLTGVNDAAIMEAQALGATFTHISQEVFPDLIEQSLNMSKVFGQQLTQSIIQLGVATNNLQVSRLTRIGISFTKQQKDQIEAHRNAGEVLKAETLIMEELEREIGNVARAMGETSIGAIDKFKTAWQNLKEELGEGSTNIFAELTKKIQPAMEYMTKWIAGSNAYNELKGLFDAHMLFENMSDVTVASLPLSTLEDALYEAQLKLYNAKNKFSDTEEDSASFGVSKKEQIKLDNLEKEVWYQEDLVSAIQRVMLARKDHNKILEAEIKIEQARKKLEQKAAAELIKSTFLDDLKKEYEFKTSLLSMDEIGIKYAKSKSSEIATYNKIMEAGIKLGIAEVDIEAALAGYTSTVLGNLKEQEKEARLLLVTEKERSDIELYGTTQQQNQQTYNELLLSVNSAYADGNISLIQRNAIMAEYWNNLDDGKEALSNEDYFDKFIKGADMANYKVDILANNLNALKDIAVTFGTDTVLGGFYAMGDSMVRGSDATDSYIQSLGGFAKSALEAASAQFLTAAAVAFVDKDYARGAMMLGLSASTGISAGVIGGAMSNASSTGSSTTTSTSTVTPNAIEPTITDASTTYTTDDTSSTPVTINNYGDASVSAEMTSVNGVRTLQVTVDSLVNNGVANGTYNKSMSNQFGVTSQRTNVR